MFNIILAPYSMEQVLDYIKDNLTATDALNKKYIKTFPF